MTAEIFSFLKPDAVLIFPTETIYGIGCSALFETSVQRVLEIKGRAAHQPPPVLVGEQSQLDALVANIPLHARPLMEAYWPGSLTLILPARDDVLPTLCGQTPDGKTRTIGVRWTAHPIAKSICAALHAPLVATSANFSGATGREAAPQSLDDIPDDFKKLVDVVFDGGAVGGLPSTVVDCSGDAPRVLRAGAIQLPQLSRL